MKRLINWYSGLSIYLKLFPFLLIYIILIKFWVIPTNLSGDEIRYIMFSKNLLNGFYSPSFPNINLWNGPGYPIFITPLIALEIPFLGIRLLNGFLLYFSLILVYETILIYCSKRVALISTILVGSYFPAFQMLRFMITETLSWFLISLICFSFIKYWKHNSISLKYLTLTAFSIAYLAMVKVIFGYVIIAMIVTAIVFYSIPKFRTSARKSLFTFGLSLIFCLPYLIYTYNLTNKPFYWTNSGSMSLYTMSTPYADELGDWSRFKELQTNPNHRIFIDSIANLKPLERDNAFKTAAIKNIKEHPKKYIINYVANIGRLLFEYPFSNKKEDVNTLFYIFPSMFAIVFISIAMFISSIYFKLIPFEFFVLLLFFLTYLFGSTLVSAYSRMFNITLPFWILFSSYVFNNFISFGIKQNLTTKSHQTNE
jgi:hypothetical protein